MTHRQRQMRRRRRQPRVRNRILLGIGVVLVAILIGLGSVVGYIVAVAASAPDITQLKPIDQGASSAVYAADGSLLGYVQSDILRTPVGWQDMPVDIRRATVAIEDKRFYEHGGVDYEGILRAAIRDIGSGKTLQGGSTITQQLVRALYIQDPKRDFKRKIREAKMASELEKHHSKTWILWQYLNDVPYGTVGGRTAIGIEAAAQTYFSRDAKDLTLPQAALLAGLPQAPSQYNPFLNPGAALARRNEVLKAMADSHYITQEDAAQAAQTSLGLHHGTLYTTRREQHFFDYIQEKLIERYGIGQFRQGGMKVYTTIDPKLQEDARRAIESNLGQPDDPSSAIVSIDPRTGYIRAMADSGTYKDRTFNLAAQGHRQPGSSFKTFVLTTAVREGVDPDTTIYVSKPLSLQLPGYGVWNVKTYDGTYGGAMTLTEATLKSDNTVYAQLDVDLGPKKVAETAHMMGITSPLDGVPSEGLGGLRVGVSPLEMADAYATLASGGIHSDPQGISRVVFADHRTDTLGRPKRTRVLDASVAGEVTKILQMNVQRGTGTAAGYGCPAAGKTGTTDHYNDAWFVGFTPTMASSVWVGYPNALIDMTDVHGIAVAGGTIPAAIWHDYMSVANPTCSNFPSAPAVSYVPFYGDHQAASGTPLGKGMLGPTTGPYRNYGGGYGRYNPGLYASPPQGPPHVPPPATAPAPSSGGIGPGRGGASPGAGGGPPAGGRGAAPHH